MLGAEWGSVVSEIYSRRCWMALWNLSRDSAVLEKGGSATCWAFAVVLHKRRLNWVGPQPDVAFGSPESQPLPGIGVSRS